MNEKGMKLTKSTPACHLLAILPTHRTVPYSGPSSVKMTTRSPMAMGGAPVVEDVTEGIASLALPELGPATKPNSELYTHGTL